MADTMNCRHCGRTIMHVDGEGWIDPEATGDDSVWRETCEGHDTFTAEHEPGTTTAKMSMRHTVTIAYDISDLDIITDTVGREPFEGEVQYLRTEDGITVGWLVHDDDAMDYEWGDILFSDFRSQEERDNFALEHIERLGPDRVFIVDKYEHSGVHYSLANTQNYPDRRWDVAPSAVIVVPADFDDPKATAASYLDEYSKWCAGDVWGLVVRKFTAGGVLIDDDDFGEVWGYIGKEYADQSLKEAIEQGGL